jgi:hypothetical protein
MADASAMLCLSVPLLAAISALYLQLYDGNERRRMAQRVRRWRRS